MDLKQNEDMIIIFNNIQKKTPLNDETNETLVKYINSELIGTDDKNDNIKGKDIKDKYNIWLMKNNYKKCKLTNSLFITRLRIYLNPCYKARYTYYADGKQKEARNVFTNIKYKV